MKIHDDHQFHGAALIQIAEDPHFTAINAIKFDGQISRTAFRINDDIGIYLKYATEPTGQLLEYKFTFTREQLEDLKKLKNITGRVFVALVCVKGREICCLSYGELFELIDRRVERNLVPEEQYVILVTLHKGKSFRIYISPPGTKGKTLGKSIVISRNDFPKELFEES